MDKCVQPKDSYHHPPSLIPVFHTGYQLNWSLECWAELPVWQLGTSSAWLHFMGQLTFVSRVPALIKEADTEGLLSVFFYKILSLISDS